MREILTPNRIANQIRQRRSNFLGSFLIVEGSTDAKVYKNFIDDQKCEISIAHNKDNAKKALEILEKDNFAGVLAIIDADFSRLDGDLPNSHNLLLTDDHDLEIMLIHSPALDKVMGEYGSEEKIKKFGKGILATLLEAGKNIGYLRWTSLKFNLSLKFENLAYSKFLDQNTLFIDITKLIKTVKNHSQKDKLIERDIQNQLESLKNDAHDLRQVCCGHDLICILSFALGKTWGTWNNNDVKPEKLEMSLRLAYEEAYFCKTQLYTSIQGWENKNQPYQVLRKAA